MPELSASQHNRNRRVQLLAVAAGVVLMAIKFFAWIATGSNAILTDALESVVNVAAGSFALFSVMLSAVPGDKNHPYGHGKIEFLSAGMEGMLITVAGLFMIGKAVYNLFVPQPISRLDLGLWLTVFTMFGNYALSVLLIKTGKATGSLVLKADGKHLRSDALSSLGLVAGLALILWTEILWMDNVIAIGFGGYIIYTGYGLVRESIGGVMDEADLGLAEEIIAVLEQNRQPQWVDMHNLRIIKYGHKLHIDCHVSLPWYYRLDKCHEELEAIEQLLVAGLDRDVELFIHPDPCRPVSCSLCALQTCPERKQPYTGTLAWTLENVLPNERHRKE